ncbi:MAG: helix-turn-helix transcriptional regulator [Armatimonadetes bacterium]|nr:helix-turn-helix transcriptional regulator [Armatimonadota bacterium]
MARLSEVSVLGIDRERGARQYDYHLSSDSPLYASMNFYQHVTAPEVDVHEGIEVGIVLEGGHERTCEEAIWQYAPGDVWLSAGWEQHGWRTTMPRTRDVVLLFLPEFLGVEYVGQVSWLTLFAVPPQNRPRVETQEMRAWMLAVGWQLARELEQERPGWQNAVRLDLLRLLLEVGREWTPPEAPSERPLLRASDLPRVLPALALVHSRPGQRVSVEEAARKCEVGRARFCTLFRNAMGITFGRFCLRSRLGYAGRLLMATNLPVEAVAERSGFADNSHLHRAFVKQYGRTPGEYRAWARESRSRCPTVPPAEDNSGENA